MLYVSRLKLRTFKSFRYADIPLNNGFVCLAGPNGSGKSNVIDGLRFAFGELSLKSLRAHRIPDLISIGSSKAEITAYLDGDKRYEIKRAIREDGKTLYKMNGKRVTRGAVIEALRPYGLDESGHNVIAQGQVQHFIEMNAKERREVLDQVAGIAEFEDKKKDALKELNVVEMKVNDASIVLREREGVLSQLEKEKDDALKYMEARDGLRSFKGSLIGLELARVDGEHSEAAKSYFELKAKEDEARKASEELDARIAALENEKFALVKQINESAEMEQSGLSREIGALKSDLAVLDSTKAAKEGELARISQSLKSVSEQRKKLEADAKKFAADAKEAEGGLSKVSGQAAAHEKARSDASRGAEAADAKVRSLLSEQAALLKALEEKRVEASAAEVELATATTKAVFVEGELSRTASAEGGAEAGERAKLMSEAGALQQELASVEGDIDRLFAKEKELNRRLPEVEKKFLEAKERYVTVASKLAAMKETPEMQAVGSILDLRDRGMLKGVHGTAGELCRFPEPLSQAVEASAGNRLNFLVVESFDVAAKAIEYLKQRKLGRCTFIPLDKKPFVFSADAREAAKKEGSSGFIIEHVEFNAAYAPAFEYVFGDTVLVDSVGAAKKIGPGKARMVTHEGDLFEASGVITGGTVSRKAGLRDKAEGERLRAEVEALKSEKDGVFSSLESIREEMNRKRRERGELEVKLKANEIELKHLEEADERGKAARKEASDRIARLRAEAEGHAKAKAEAETRLARARAEAGAVDAGVKRVAGEIEAAKGYGAKSKAREMDDEFAKLTGMRSELEAKLAGLRAEAGVARQRLASIAEEEKELEAGEAALEKALAALEKEAAGKAKLLAEKEGKAKHVSSALSELYGKRNVLDGEIGELAKERGKRMHGSERARRQLTELEVRKASLETRLADLKAEAAGYLDVSPVEGDKESLEARIRECEAVMSAMGNVNLKAPETYEEMRAVIGDVKERIGKLAEEKRAVMRMIEEIDSHKKEVFTETFHKLNDNFKRLYSHTMRGEATLTLENAANPFEGGMSILVKDESRKEKYLESMSGGEKALLSVIFVFSIQMFKPAPFYILDEADAALDKENSLKLARLLGELSKSTQFIVVTHNDQVLSNADIALGVSKSDGTSRIVGIELKRNAGKESGGEAGKPGPEAGEKAAEVSAIAVSQA
ncbi:MAG: chromosome segregation protein SMC [Candidatus ainarchaeum sp.]|nr:chromosome segregation protein SMC [Candidatus ainarchaeum sp.]